MQRNRFAAVLSAGIVAFSVLLSPGGFFWLPARAADGTLLIGEPLQHCLEKEKGIRRRNQSLLALSAQAQDKIASLVQRVDDYYGSSVQTPRRSLPDYEARKRTLDDRAAAVAEAYHRVRRDADSFSCTRPDPAGSLDDLESHTDPLREALAAYRAEAADFTAAIYLLADPASVTRND